MQIHWEQYIKPPAASKKRKIVAQTFTIDSKLNYINEASTLIGATAP